MPSSLRRGMIWSFTMIIFLKESLIYYKNAPVLYSVLAVDLSHLQIRFDRLSFHDALAVMFLATHRVASLKDSDHFFI